MYTARDLSDTIVAQATPPGVGAIGILRLSGPDAIEIAARSFRGKDLRQQASHTAHYGGIEDEDGRLIDEVLATLFIAPRSYTGEDVVEVSCHGSPYVLQQVLQLFLRRGARLAQPGEFTMRAFLHGRMDLSQAEAVADLIAAESEASHQTALRQLRGGFSNEIQRLREELIHFASLIELELDFGEEDVEFANRGELERLIRQAQSLLQNLIQSFELGNAIKNGVSTVIAGRPNAGKSTLLNALLNEERAIVSDIEGTTRDTIEEVLNIHGIQFRIIDTAGIREAHDQIEAIGVAKTMEKIQQSALLIYLFDVIRTSPEEVHKDLAQLAHPGIQLLVVANKMDLNPYAKEEHYFPEVRSQRSEVRSQRSEVRGEETGGEVSDSTSQPLNLSTSQSPSEAPHTQTHTPSGEDPPAHPDSTRLRQASAGNAPQPLNPSTSQSHSGAFVPISAINKMNLEYLKEKLYEAALAGKTPRESTIVTNARHYDALRRAHDSLEHALQGLTTGITGDFLAMDIRRALAYLGEITGEIGVEDLLDNIFSRFCIGK